MKYSKWHSNKRMYKWDDEKPYGKIVCVYLRGWIKIRFKYGINQTARAYTYKFVCVCAWVCVGHLLNAKEKWTKNTGKHEGVILIDLHCVTVKLYLRYDDDTVRTRFQCHVNVKQRIFNTNTHLKINFRLIFVFFLVIWCKIPILAGRFHGPETHSQTAQDMSSECF